MKVHLLVSGMTGCGLLMNQMPAGEFWLSADDWKNLDEIAEEQGTPAERCLRCDEFFGEFSPRISEARKGSRDTKPSVDGGV